MKKAILFFLCISFFALESNSQTISGSFMHDGLQRDYVLYIPTNYTGTTAVPLILNFHGFLGSGTQQMGNSNFKPIADTAGFIVVHPTGTALGGFANHWNVGGWTNTSTIDDIGFASALIDTIVANYNINLQRVYSTGFSNGGFFSHRLACELGSRIAAIASVSGTFTPEMQTNCAPSHPTPVLQIHGTTDGTVPYPGQAGNGGMASVDTVINYWVSANNCNATPTITALPDLNTGDGSTVEHMIYANGTAGVQVELLKITGGTHVWPNPANASSNQDINASLEIWKFFSQFSNAAVSTNTIVKNNFNLFPNPAQNELNINIPINGTFDYQLYTITGSKVMSGIFKTGMHQLSLSEVPKGIYILKIAGEPYKIIKD